MVVGDVIPVIAAWLSRRPVATYLVAYSSHEGRLRLPWPCGELLASSLAVFGQDQLTADDLTGQLQRPVHFIGNLFMDPVVRRRRRCHPPDNASDCCLAVAGRSWRTTCCCCCN